MRGSKIIVSTNPRGKIESIICKGALKPGTFVELVPSVDAVGGLFQYRNVTRANGAKGEIAIVLEDEDQGFTPSTAYVDGTIGKIYWPVQGEELNALVRETAGTGTTGIANIGDLLAIESGTGELMAGGALASQPFKLLEHPSEAVKADTLHWVKFLGTQA